MSNIDLTKMTPGPWKVHYERNNGRESVPRADNSSMYVRTVADGSGVAHIELRWSDTGVPFWPNQPKPTRKQVEYEEHEANGVTIAAAYLLPEIREVLSDTVENGEGCLIEIGNSHCGGKDCCRHGRTKDLLARLDAALKGEG